MRFSTCVAVCVVVVGFCGLSGSKDFSSAHAQETSGAQPLEDKAFADLAQPEPEKVSYAVSYFMQHKTPAAKVVPRVLPLLKIKTNDRNNNSILSGLAELLEHCGPQSKDAIPQLIEIAGAANQNWTRERTRNALAAIGPNDERVFAAFRSTLLAPREPGDVVSSAQALAQMGPIATRAIPDINRQIRAMEKARAWEYSGGSDAHRTLYALGEIALKNSPPFTRQSDENFAEHRAGHA